MTKDDKKPNSASVIKRLVSKVREHETRIADLEKERAPEPEPEPDDLDDTEDEDNDDWGF